jgi:hypothetical protein
VLFPRRRANSCSCANLSGLTATVSIPLKVEILAADVNSPLKGLGERSRCARWLAAHRYLEYDIREALTYAAWRVEQTEVSLGK